MGRPEIVVNLRPTAFDSVAPSRIFSLICSSTQPPPRRGRGCRSGFPSHSSPPQPYPSPRVRTTRAGIPTAIAPGGRSVVTTAPPPPPPPPPTRPPPAPPPPPPT